MSGRLWTRTSLRSVVALGDVREVGEVDEQDVMEKGKFEIGVALLGVSVVVEADEQIIAEKNKVGISCRPG